MLLAVAASMREQQRTGQDAAQVAQEGCARRQQLDVQQLRPAHILRARSTTQNPSVHSFSTGNHGHVL
jgi:hypothetical protein